MPVTVVVDTNFILVPAQFGVDIFTEAERILERRVRFEVLSCVVAEIESLSQKASRKEQRWFGIARDFLNRCEIVDHQPSTRELSVDDQILEYLAATRHVLGTNDKELKRKVRDCGIAVLMLRGKKQLMLEGAVG